MHLLKMTLKVYRERGFVSLVRRVFVYLRDLLKGFPLICRISIFGKADILYISGCPGGSRQYRCENQKEELFPYGLRAMVLPQSYPFFDKIIKYFKVFIFQRVIYNKHIEKVIDTIKEQQKTIIYETDDLVFDPKYIPYLHYYNYFGKEEKTWYDNGIGREILEDPYIENCIVSTPYLAQKLKEKYPNKNVFISSNRMNKKYLSWSEKAFFSKDNFKKKDGKIRIGYFSGSKSHDKDFETVADVLLRILKENKNSVLTVVGYLSLGEKFGEVRAQIEVLPFVSLKKFPKVLLHADINIIPLEIDNPFCQAKSGLKYFEAGILGVPTVATATDTFKKMIEHGKTGLLAKTEKEWYDNISLLISDKDLREKIGNAARKDSIENWTTLKEHQESKKLAEFIIKLLLN